MPLKILHTSDWHLGKRLFKMERLPEQELFLDWIITQLREQHIDHLFIAGDIFDVPQPPHRALRLFYDFLGRVTRETKTTTWIIGGNHDAGTLLEAPEALLDPSRVKVWGTLRDNPSEQWAKLPLGKGHIDLCLLPYFRHHELGPWRERYGKDQIEGDWPEKMVESFLQDVPAQSLGRIFMGHHLFGMFEAAGSEQALALSGLDSIPLDWLKAFDYAALGHIHKPQVLRKQKPLVWYSGSPIPMRFSETAPKQVNILTWQETGEFTCDLLKVPTWRQLVSVVATESDWDKKLSAISKVSPLPPSVELELRLNAPIPGLVESIRTRADELGIESLNLLPIFNQAQEERATEDWTALLKLGPVELFESFYLAKFPEETLVPADLREDMKNLLEEAKRAPPST